MLNERKITGFLAILFVALSLGFIVHRSPTFAGGFLGHLIGIIGALIMCLTLIYPFKKRVQKKRGKQNPLHSHIYFGLIGPCLVVIHAAHKFANLIGVVVFLSMFVVVFSGIVGKFLFRKVNRTLKQHQNDLSLLRARFEELRKDASLVHVCLRRPDASGAVIKDDDENEQTELELEGKCEELLDIAHAIAEAEYIEKAYSGAKRLFTRWIRIHYMLTVLLFSVMIVHILTTFYYGFRWLR
jgi:Ca2+/Na+ antiporter